MPRRLKLTLVYFGLIDDPDLETYLRRQPKNAWRVAAVTVPLILVAVVVLAVVVSVLVKLDSVAGWLSSAAVGLLVGFVLKRSARRRERSGADDADDANAR